MMLRPAGWSRGTLSTAAMVNAVAPENDHHVLHAADGLVVP